VKKLNKIITLKETIELFLTRVIYDISNNNEIPKINFLFNEEAYNLFNHIKDNPLKIGTGWKPNINESDIIFLKNSINPDYPTIYIKDHIKFFTYLTEIANASIKSFE
jgi:hypothetical protein